MGLDIYFKRVRSGQTASEGLTERKKKRNREFKEFLHSSKGMTLDEVKNALKDFLWSWEWGKASEAHTFEELLGIVQEFYPKDKEDDWELMDYEENNCRRQKFYFRKVNCLYGYCANHNLIEDGEVAMLDHEQMVDILNRAKEILSQPTKEEQLEKGEELLPTQDGFFFGNTYYNDYYLQDIEEVRDKFKGMLDEWDDAYAVIFSW